MDDAEFGPALFRRAARSGNLERVKRLLSHDPTLVHHVNTFTGWTALTESASESHASVVAELLRAGSEVDLRDRWEGRTPLSLACSRGTVEVVSLLLEAGADPNLRTTAGFCPLITASRCGYQDVVRCLLQQGRCDPDIADGMGRTALFHSASGGKDGVVEELLANGADFMLGPCIRPRAAAVVGGHRQCAEMLGEAERALWLYKAWRLTDERELRRHDAPAAHIGARARAAVCSFLCARGGPHQPPLPKVEVTRCSKIKRKGKKDRHDARKDEKEERRRREEELRRGVAELVVYELDAALFVELLALMGGRGPAVAGFSVSLGGEYAEKTMGGGTLQPAPPAAGLYPAAAASTSM